jgi:hypothetical protein
MGIRVIIQEKRGKDVKVQAKKNTQAMGFACLAMGLLFFQCPGLDSNQHDRRSPPPQDGVSTNFTTRAFCDSTGARTQDPYIKSVLLYQLSYRVILAFQTRVQI